MPGREGALGCRTDCTRRGTGRGSAHGWLADCSLGPCAPHCVPRLRRPRLLPLSLLCGVPHLFRPLQPEPSWSEYGRG